MTKERNELFSEKVHAGSKTYFFDVNVSVDGINYLTISESKKTDDVKLLYFSGHEVKHNLP